MIVSFTAGEKDAGRRLSNVLRRDMKLSASLVGRIKFTGGIKVNGARMNTDYRLVPGDVVEADPLAADCDPGITPEPGGVEVLFDNGGLIAVNKPCGMLVHPSSSRFAGTLAGRVAGYLESRGEAPVCHAVNRLDRDTSGAVLFARDSRLTTMAISALRAPDAGKEYIAAAFGAVTPESGTFCWPLSRLAGAESMRREVTEGGQSAETEYETLASGVIGGDAVSLLRLRLKTGRTHQIRVHCAHAGIPLLGDALYGTEESAAASERLGVGAQALHAARLAFTDPLSGGRVDISAPLRRDDMKKIMNELEFCY